MAIDFALQKPCAARRHTPEVKLRSMVRHWGIAEFAIAQFREKFPHADNETLATKCTVEIAVKGPDGLAIQTQVTIGQLLDMIEPLSELDGECKGCPANVSGRSFGCIGKVNYPISKEAEDWLLARLPDDAKDANLVLLLKYLADLDIDGAPVEAQRSRSRMFERKEAAVRKWGGWFGSKAQITSSQLLQMLAFSEAIGPEQAQLYTRLLGLAKVGAEPASPSNTVEQLKILLRAVNLAGRLDARLAVDA
ncbi:hypothetical protein J2X20_001968 [Pelomonas saccharophila]|uniref:Uncharacterized protein n=1 Tax=Roseateles saccharophilus TaxID=304 RepID=A0ABU1YKF1_ROSSA|nr:hypothetical protein [Roseateles saccharophilus]MDR7269339.1 hypothetical protein [Roseateles saccharophilus]